MTVTTILINFRSALLAVIPMVERLGIAWKRPEAYDEWDAIASVLFEKLVIEALRWSLPPDEREKFQLPRYDLLLPSYAGLGSLEVVHPLLGAGRWVFHAFGTEREPLDVIEVRPLSDSGESVSERYETCPVEGASFRLRLGPRAQPIEEVELGAE
jgi:hypothetical protein